VTKNKKIMPCGKNAFDKNLVYKYIDLKIISSMNQNKIKIIM